VCHPDCHRRERSDLDDEQECGFDRDRHELAQLLLSRNCQMAAKVVAVSRYRTTYVADSHYCVLLSVPPELYDTARADLSDVLSAACADIVGPEAFHSLKSQVLRPPYEVEWVAKAVEARNARWVGLGKT
jgi:hypothetical protein